MPPLPKKLTKPSLGKVIHGNCIEEIPKLGLFDFVFADPPFNIGQDYAEYDDRLGYKEYAEFTLKWLSACCNALKPGGVIALHGPDELAEMYLVAMTASRLKRKAWVIWHYRFGQCGRVNWINSHCHCLIYSYGAPAIWNPEAVLVESDRVGYGDKRVAETENGGKRLPFTVWGVPSDGPYWGRVQGNNAERRDNSPNQLPEVYLERLLRAYTNPGSRVLDPFGGSGTTITVADALGRDCTTIDVGKATCEGIEDRRRKGAVRVNRVL